MPSKAIESSLTSEDLPFEIPIRPQTLQDFIGQDEVRQRLGILLSAAKKRGEALGHCLLCGPPGLGKTTLANILAREMNSSIVVSSGPMLEKAGDLAGILTNLQQGDIFFIDEIHRIPRAVEEYLYQAMEDFALDLMIDTGPSARSVQVKLNKFTLIGATTRAGLLTAPMRTRFAFHTRLDYYTPSVLEKIVRRTANLLNFQIDQGGLAEVAARSRGTPRIANHLLRWVRDFALTHSEEAKEVKANASLALKALKMLAIDERGLDEMDKKILEVIIDHYEGGPVGLNTIAVAIGEEGHTIEEVYEPFLILQGFLKRTPRGRVATALAYQHLNRK